METPNKEERLWATIAHLSAFAIYLVPLIGHMLGPLIVWLVKREGNPFVDANAKEALNFQITLSLVAIAAFLLTFTFILAVITIPVLLCLHLYQVVCIVIAAIKANEGVMYRYPLTWRLIK